MNRYFALESAPAGRRAPLCPSLVRWLVLGLVSVAAWAAGLPRLTAAPTLNSLTLSAGTLVPSFAAGALTYSAAVGHEVASVTVTTTTGFQNLVTINGASTSSRSLALNQGANVITIVVSETAALAARPPIARAGARPQAFGDTQTYTVTVTRAAQAFVVTTTADEFDTPSGSSRSLREALRDAAAFAGPGVITFAAGLDGGTLTLGSELVVDDADGVTVDASGLAGGLTLNGGGAVRHFNVSSAGNLTLRALTLSGGNTTGNGGSIHSTGTLTAERCTFAGNSAHTGGAIFADNGSSTVLRQCTLAGNTATVGNSGAMQNRGVMTLSHCTVAGNTAVSAPGGFFHNPATGGSCSLEYSILAGNTPGDLRKSANLVLAGVNVVRANPSGAGEFTGTGTILQADPLLGSLAANNGPTPTLRTAPQSPARNAAVGSTITADQRGYPLFGTADIGAYEGQLGAIAAVTIAEDTATSALPFSVGTVGTLGATSGNTALVPNANLTLGGSGSSRTLTATPVANANGIATITVTDTPSGETTSIVLTVTPVADTPSVTGATTAEDTQTTTGLVLSRNAADGTEVTHFKVTAISNGTLFQNNGTTAIAAGSFITSAQASAGLKFTPAANFNGAGSFTFRASTSAVDAGLGGSQVTATITVTPVNDAPIATNLSEAQTYTEDTALDLTDIVVTDPDNAPVTATLTLSVPAAGSLSTATAGSVTSTYVAGTGVWTANGPVADVNTLLVGVTFNPALNFNSDFTIATSVTDGTTTLTGSKAITGTPVNDPPTLSDLPDATIPGDGTATLGPVAFTVGDVDSDVAAMTLSASSSKTALVPVANIVFGGSGANRTLTVTPVAGQSGTTTLRVTVTDAAGASAFDEFVLTVTPAPDLRVESPAGGEVAPGGSVDLGAIALGASGTPQTFTLRNPGSQDLTGLALTVDGAMPGDFAVSPLGATTLVPGASTTFTVTFTPGGPDFRTARLVVASNDPDENPFPLRLTGRGTSGAALQLAQRAYAKPSNTGTDDYFGFSVAVSGDTVVVGAVGEASNATGVNGTEADNTASGAGAAYVFVRNGSTWTQQAYLKASNTGGGDFFGWSVAVSGDTVVVGARLEDSNATGVNGNQGNNTASFAGAAYVFVRSGTGWTQQAYLKASNTGGGDFFGYSVAVSGDTVVVGAIEEDSNATGVNGNGADNSAGLAGAAYVFVPSALPIALALSATGVAENQPAGTVVGTLAGTDIDFGHAAALTFSLVSGPGDTDNLQFTVVGPELHTAAVFDFETQGAYSLRLRATDPTGLTYDQVVTVTVTDVNEAPVAGADNLSRPTTTRVAKVLKSVLLANDSDADLDPLTLTAVGNPLPVGATVALVGNFVVYTAPSATAGSGSFTYTVSDGPGGHSVIGTVTVTEENPAANAGPNAVQIRAVGADVGLTFIGVPGGRYRVQYTTATAPPYAWLEFSPTATYLAAPNGVFTHTDVAPADPVRLYRAIGE